MTVLKEMVASWSGGPSEVTVGEVSAPSRRMLKRGRKESVEVRVLKAKRT